MPPISKLAERRRRLAIAAGLAVLATFGESAARITEERAEPPCVLARSETQNRYPGYDHVVRLQNRCDAAVRCAVSSDVRSDPVRVTVEPRAQVEVVLWRGSPARVYNAKVDCRWADER
jgi:hypothetical protein